MRLIGFTIWQQTVMPLKAAHLFPPIVIVLDIGSTSM